MSDISISYKNNEIASMDATGTKTLLTEGKYCEDNIVIEYIKPSSSGDTIAVTFFMAPSGDDYDITYVDANGNTVDTNYWTLDTEYGESVTVNATSGTPIATSCVSPIISSIPTPTNTSVFFSKTGQAGTKPPVNYAFQTFIVD